MRPAYVRRIYRPAETRGAGFGVRTAAQKSTGYFTATASISTSAPIGSAATSQGNLQDSPRLEDNEHKKNR